MHSKGFQILFLLTCSVLIFVSCKNASFDAALDFPETSMDEMSPDKSEITVSNDNVADGVTPAQVTIIARSYRGSPIAGMKMSIAASGSANVIVPCTTTDTSGLSRCWLYTTRAEIKTIQILGAVTKKIDVVFQSPRPLRSNFAFVSSGGDLKLPSGHRVISTSGSIESDFIQKDTQGAVRLRSTVLSSVIPD